MTLCPDKDFDDLGLPGIDCTEQATVRAMFGYGRGLVDVCQRHAEHRAEQSRRNADAEGRGTRPGDVDLQWLREIL